MRALVVVVLAACTDPVPPVAKPSPLDAIWSESIRPGDLIVAVPGTGGYTDLGVFIDRSPTLDGRVDVNPIVLEQAIAAAQRAGIDVESGAVTLALWGTGATRPTFDYESLGGLRVRFDVIGGRSILAAGALIQNLLRYTRDNADLDARDLEARIHALAPNGHVILVAHSWGGAVAEYLVDQLGDPSIAFVVAAGVPATIAGYHLRGPGLAPSGGASLYEVDRPDDMVHNMNPSGTIEGHQYDIMFGDAFQGSYGITTMELSCHGVPGRC